MRYDIDHDGYLEFYELVYGLKMIKINLAHDECEALERHFKANSSGPDGLISLNDFLKLCQRSKLLNHLRYMISTCS